MSKSTRFVTQIAVLLTLLLFIVCWFSILTSTNVASRNIDVIVFINDISPTIPDEDAMLKERPPVSSGHNDSIENGSLAVFVFHTSHSTLAKLQLHLIRKLAINLVALELFTDGEPPDEMRNVAHLYDAQLHIFPADLHSKMPGPSYRNADVVNFAIATMGKDYLANGTAVLLLDGDVFPLSFFSARTLLNSHDIVCRRYPRQFTRYCWIGFICLAPQLSSTINDFNVSPVVRGKEHYDAGGRTIEYLHKYPNTSFSWVRETILYKTDQTLFSGVTDTDIRWIKSHFGECDKCGPEVFVSPNDNYDIFFYHMISASSQWRFSNLEQRLQALYDSVINSSYSTGGQLSTSELTASVRKVQKMNMVPFHGDLTCSSVCARSKYTNETKQFK